MARDFSTISPSAKALLLVKSQTSLPFAREAAELLFGAEAVEATRRQVAGHPDAELRRKHFEHRARSVDRALEGLGATRVLEIAAGLSFRGLAMADRPEVAYVDSDLPAIAEIKADLVARLHPAPLRGSLQVRALDALDAAAFRAAAAALPEGAITIVHEGLLMYLDDAEKARLAANVREALLERGGAWVTADVYVRSARTVFRDEKTRKFIEEHRVDERKFADWGAAEAFFEGARFAIAGRVSRAEDPWRVRETWVLRPRG